MLTTATQESLVFTNYYQFIYLYIEPFISTVNKIFEHIQKFLIVL